MDREKKTKVKVNKQSNKIETIKHNYFSYMYIILKYFTRYKMYFFYGLCICLFIE